MTARPIAYVALALALPMLACARHVPAVGRVAPSPPASEAGPLRSPDAFRFDFQWRQRVSASWSGGSQSFDAVLQKRHGELLLMGLSPMGQPGFVLRLSRGGAIGVENRTGRPLPFPPAFILADVQRVFYPWLSPASPDFSGERRGELDGLRVIERWRAGRLRARSFERLAAPGKTVRIRYEGDLGQDAPERVVLDNGWFDYRLVIETLEQARL